MLLALFRTQTRYHNTPKNAPLPREDLAVGVVDLPLVCDHDHGVVGIEARRVLLTRDAEDAKHLHRYGSGSVVADGMVYYEDRAALASLQGTAVWP